MLILKPYVDNDPLGCMPYLQVLLFGALTAFIFFGLWSAHKDGRVGGWRPPYKTRRGDPTAFYLIITIGWACWAVCLLIFLAGILVVIRHA